MNFNPSKLKYEFQDFIGIYENAFTQKECEDTIKLFELYHKNNYTYGRPPQSLNSIDDTHITLQPTLELDWSLDFIASFQQRFYNYIYPLYNNQYPILQNLKKHKVKQIKIQKTCPTQGYHTFHCENNGDFDFNDRVMSWILYLNDINEGGETEFLYQSIRIKPKTGTLILFPAYFTHTHRGNPPLKECKYIATGWVHFLCTDESQGAVDFPNLNIKTDNTIRYS